MAKKRKKNKTSLQNLSDSATSCVRNTGNTKMNRQEATGHLGVSNDPNVTSTTKHSSNQKAMATSSGSGRSHKSIVGQIGVTTNPQVSSSDQHGSSSHQSFYSRSDGSHRYFYGLCPRTRGCSWSVSVSDLSSAWGFPSGEMVGCELVIS